MPQPTIPCAFFNKWSRDMAYVLGFWFADGHMAKTGYNISFTSIDREHLDAVAEKIGVPNSVYFADGCYRLVFSRKEAWQNLSALGGVPAKSLIAEFPTVPTRFLRDFIRGYVDGDGSLGWTNLPNSSVPLISVVGTQPFLLDLKRLVLEQTGLELNGIYKAEDHVAFLKATGVKAKCFTHWLYQNKGMSLQRKQAIADGFKLWAPKPMGYKKSCLTPLALNLFKRVLPS